MFTTLEIGVLCHRNVLSLFGKLTTIFQALLLDAAYSMICQVATTIMTQSQLPEDHQKTAAGRRNNHQSENSCTRTAETDCRLRDRWGLLLEDG